MRLGVKLNGSRFTRQMLDHLADAAEITANEVVANIAYSVQDAVVESIQGGAKSGRIYRRYNPSRLHQASAPGQAPADDLGNLANSYEVTFVRINQYAWRSVVGSPLAYAAALEYGNPTTNLLPRPHLGPVVELVEEELDAIIADAWIGNAP